MFRPRLEVHRDQQDSASLFAGPIDVQDVPASSNHVPLEQGNALFVDDLDVGDELPRQVTDRPHRDLQGVTGGQFVPDLQILSTLDGVGDPDPDHQVVRVAGPLCDHSGELS